MKRTLVFILAFVMLLTSCAPAANMASFTFNPQDQARSAAMQATALSAQPQNDGSDSSLPTLSYTYDNIDTLPAGPSLEYEFLPASPQWSTLVSGDTPAAFGATYELADNVLTVNKTVTESIASAGQLLAGSAAQKLLPNKIIAEGGYIPRAVLDAAAQQKARVIENGTVVVDEASGTAFKVAAPTEFTGAFDADAELHKTVAPLENTYAVTQPELHEVLKDFSMGGENGETVTLTRANVIEFAPNVEKNLVLPTGYKTASFGDSYKGFKYLSDDPLMKLQFQDEQLDARLGSGSPISVIVSGGLGVDKIDVSARYTASDGYHLTMTLKQESYLVVEMEAEIAEEVVIPIFGIHVAVKAGDKEIARIAGGVFVIVGMDGTLKLEVETREFSSTTAGVRGSTKFYIPTSVHPVYDPHFESDGDVDLAGDIDGYLKFGPMLKLDVFGFKLVGAGAFLGVGARVQTDGYFLNVELYGLLQVYIDFLGKHLSLVNAQPTILSKRQTDTAGFQVSFLEAYVYPGRVGGILKKDPPGKGQPYVVAENIQYRVLVVPAGETFDPNVAGDIDKPTIRKYPADGYAVTNAKGEFIQMDEHILYGGDLACLELRVGDRSYFSAFVSPTLPFEKVAITEADYFNDYVKGQVQPVRVINWYAQPGDSPYEWVYYGNGLITLNPYLSTTWNVHIPYGGQARTLTDEKGRFDTQNTFADPATGTLLPNAYFDVYENPEDYGSVGGFDFRLDYNNAASGDSIQCKTTSPLLFTRMVEEVPNSYEPYEEGGKHVDRMSYDEYIWIVNPHGTRTVTETEFGYSGGMFSTQDYIWDVDGSTVLWYDSTFTPNSATPLLDKSGDPVLGKCKLTPVLDENGNPTGATLFSQRVTVEWVWQEHPNPVKITSADHTTATTAGGSFQVTATGYAPFDFTLTGAPQGVVFEKSSLGINTGLMTIPAGLAEGEYKFTIRASEDRTAVIQSVNALNADRYEGNDPSPPDEQLFTLTVTKAAQTPEPSQSPEASQTPEPARTAPVIAEEDHGYVFTKLVGGGDLTVPVNASGSTPISWTLEKKSERYFIPEEVTIDPDTGVLTVKEGIEAGSYSFVIRAENDVGFDKQECALKVMALSMPSRRPILSASSGGAGQLVQLNAVRTGDTLIAAQLSAQTAQEPLNSVTLRWEDDEDVYTKDRFTVNGALYVRWHAFPVVTVRGSESFDYYGDYTSGDTEQRFYDVCPRCDNYHYWPDALPDAVREKLLQGLNDQLSDFQRGSIDLVSTFNAEELLGNINQFSVNQISDGFSYLEYGSLIGQMAAQKGGAFQVELNTRTGTIVTGKYFVGLQNNKAAQLSFCQGGATVTFAGKDIKTASEYDMLDFGYYAGAFSEQQMLSAAGSTGESFTYAFNYHGKLPGTATFEISTDIAEGMQVNVYKYDAATNGFTLIAGNIAVGAGGVVSYKNNTMSEYLITTQTISGAQVSDMAGWQGLASNIPWLPAVIIGLAAAGAAVAVWVFLRRRKRSRKAQ